MSRSLDERLQDIRGEGVLNSANNRAMNPVMSASSLEKEKHEKQLLGKINSGNETSGYRAVDLMKPSNKQMTSSMTHISVGSAPLPPMPPLQAPLLTSILPGPGHPLIPPGLSHAPLLRGAALPAQIPLMGRAAAAVAPPRASIVSSSLRASSIPLLKSSNNQNQIQITGKGSSIFSPIVPSSRVSSPLPGSNLSRSIEHTRDAKITHIQSEIHNIRGTINASSATQLSGTATVQVIASGTASLAHPILSQSKAMPVLPNPNVLKFGPANAQHSQPTSCMSSGATVSMVTTFKTAVPPNSITISKIFPQPILIPSTTSGTPSTTRPDLQDHQKLISSNTSHGRHTPPSSSSHHGSYAGHHHYGINVSSYSTSHQSHLPYTTSASVENKNDRLKPGNPLLQYAIGSYYPIDSAFSHPLGVHALAPSSQYVHRYVQSIPGTNSGPFPMFVEGARGFAAPLPIPGMTAPSRDSHHHSSAGESPIMNNSYSLHNFPNLQPSNYHGPSSSSNSSSSRSGPGILRKRTADGYAVHCMDRMSSPTKQEVRSDSRSESHHISRSDNAPPVRQESPRLLCDEKSTYNDNYNSTADSSVNSNNSGLSSSITEIKREQDVQPAPLSTQLINPSHQNFPGSSATSGPTTEASPRKKPRKQNVITTEDTYSSKVSIEEDDVEMENRKQDKRKDIKKEGAVIRIQKPIPKLKLENSVETKESEHPELDETSKYYTFIRKPKFNVLGDYKINTKAAYHHFYRYSDVKAKEEKKPSSAELANNKKILQSISGWRVHHMSSQMDDLCALENEVCSKLFEFQRELPRPNKHYMITTACHDLQNGRKSATVDEQLRILHELIQGNIQRCQLSMEQIGEAKQTMLRVLDHKPKILEIIKRHKHKRTAKKKMPSSSS